MHADSLTDDLKTHLYWWLGELPSRRCRWVMDWSWFNECRKVEPFGGWAFMPPVDLGTPETMLGLPVDIRDHDDRPGWMWRVPHLEAA